MAELVQDRISELRALSTAVQDSHSRSTRDALLEHARMGRSVCESDGNGKVVWIPPAEIFARYGLDEFGRPKTMEETP
ncbi:hypothetical protein [Limnoglobus roseus]|uniref:Uncharacterized protein n=1 Tax=Limnoglobus roseus TaxID=2598579 RepID=A0A5C1A7X7_9BACT|nr:hypothetical protein [Limnoglobus roseus]QEL14595.1 hypothetical protein PX52LOC_01486 [Limnoglobus roseus]